MRVRVFAYKPGSRSARDLSRGTGALRIRTNSRFRARPGDLVINWGASRPNIINRNVLEADLFQNAEWLNHPVPVELAANKLSSMQVLQERNVPVPPFTDSIHAARRMIDDGHSIVCRTVLNGSGGRGIVLADRQEELVPAPLYCQYIKKYDEYRIHCGNQEIIDVQQKRRRNGVEEVDQRIRNHDRGWVFCRQEVAPPRCVCDAARNAVAALGLHFGAVDVIYNRHYDQAYVLEVNTAPGLEGTTLTNYTRFFNNLVQEIQEAQQCQE